MAWLDVAELHLAEDHDHQAQREHLFPRVHDGHDGRCDKSGADGKKRFLDGPFLGDKQV